jgi:hypothetical protein
MSSGRRPLRGSAAAPRYEVASIKLNTDPEAPLAFQVESNGTFSATAWVNRGHATPVIESDAMAKKTKNAAKGKSRSQKLSVKKQPIKAAAPKQGKDVKEGASLRIRRFD